MTRIGEDLYQVDVRDGDSSTTHEVSVDPRYAARIAPGAEPTTLVEASFRFLLEREPKESILRSFDLPLIGRYFPEYESEMRARFR